MRGGCISSAGRGVGACIFSVLQAKPEPDRRVGVEDRGQLQPQSGLGICLGLRIGTGWGWSAAQASSRGCKALGMVSVHSLLSLLFTSTGVKNAHGIIGQRRGEDAMGGCREDKADKRKDFREWGGGRARCYHGKLMPGQTEPDLHPNTVLITDLLCWDSLLLWDICWPSLWYGKHRQAVHTPGSPQGTLRVGETEVEGS